MSKVHLLLLRDPDSGEVTIGGAASNRATVDTWLSRLPGVQYHVVLLSVDTPMIAQIAAGTSEDAEGNVIAYDPDGGGWTPLGKT